MWIPTRQPPASVCSEKASSISVVAASSIEKAATSARGKPSAVREIRLPETGTGREILVEETLEVVIVRRTDRAAAVEQVQPVSPISLHAASSALVSKRLRSGL